MAPTRQDFTAALSALLATARTSAPFLDVRAGDLHRQVGGYPGHNHRMPVCCQAMRDLMQPNDQILSQPPKGNGASLTIRYGFSRT